MSTCVESNGKVDKDEVKRALDDRWVELFQSIGIPADYLDGKNHPCPKCGGEDRFRLLDRRAGALFCNQCRSKKCGDGLAAIRWWRDCGFKTALNIAAEFAGLGNGQTKATDQCRIRLAPLHRQKTARAKVLSRSAQLRSDDSIRFPVFGPDGKQCSEFRIWVTGDEKQRKGKLTRGKPAGLFLPLNSDRSPRLPQAGETWHLVEGVKDAAALHGLGLLACGLPTSHLNPKFAPLFRDVDVVPTPDRDPAGETGAKKSARALHGHARSIRIATLPAEFSETHGADVRDVLQKPGGRELVLKAIADAKEWKPGTAAAEESFVKVIADLICKDNHFARDVGGKLFRYRDGAYRSKAETYICAEVKRLCVALEATENWSTRFANEVVEWIGVDAPELWERPPIDVVNVANGLLQLRDGKLLPHTPEFLSPTQLPVEYDPKAKCPKIDTFVKQVFPKDAIKLAYELPAWTMTPDTSIQKAALLIGLGGNGKSTYLAMLVAFLGKPNCVGLSLHKLESNRFSVGRLAGKLANICPDLPTEHLSGTSMFKALTGGDFNIEGEHKFKDGFSFDPFCRLIFSANSPPRSSDASEAFFDRWLVVPFDARFRGTKREVTRKELDERLSAPSELSGLLNRAVAAWRAIQKRGGKLSEPESVQAAWAEFHAMTDPLTVWLDQNTVDDPQAVVPKQVLRSAYGAACQEAGRPPLTETAFGYAIANWRSSKARPALEQAQRTINGRRPWCYVGIGLRGDNPTDAQGAQGAQGFSTLPHARRGQRG